ncbi:MAG TPA: hypothetical protein EYM65_10300 [Dehalococcoidia bacterium]|nr:hypothetical protein [Dehalococcoidia bacterium]
MSLDRATFGVSDADLGLMVLEKTEMPEEFLGHQVVREGPLNNEAMAENGFANSTAERFKQAGRINGFMREFGPTSNMSAPDGFNFLAASVAHLFATPDSVVGWMQDVFLKDFEENIGEGVGEGHQLVSAQRLEPKNFFDEAVALRILQGGPTGLISSTVIDFRVGRILGVAFVGTVGDHERMDLATEVGLALEKRIVRIALGGG